MFSLKYLFFFFFFSTFFFCSCCFCFQLAASSFCSFIMTRFCFLSQVYSGCKFTFSKIPNPFTQTKRVCHPHTFIHYTFVFVCVFVHFNLKYSCLCFCFCPQINGQWKGVSAGGCGNYKDSYKHNPIYQINLERSGPLLIELRGSR